MSILVSPQSIKESHILVTGIVRNVGESLEREIDIIDEAFSYFERVSWLVVESDSDDDTLEQIKRIAKTKNAFSYHSLGQLRDRIPLRTDRISFCRNFYLDEMRANPIYRDIDYIVIADLDGMNGMLTKAAVLSCWKRDDWDVCTANQRGLYYDIWALRHQIWSPNDCWAQYHFLVAHDIPKEMALNSSVYSRMICLRENNEWLPVDSAFGGLAIYRRSALDTARYNGLDMYGNEVCEHVFLHKELREAGQRIFINPALINGGLNEHSRETLWVARWRRRIKNACRVVLRLRL